jgi:hypothetical protein
MALIAIASILGAIYTSTPAHARDLVGSQTEMNSQPAENRGNKSAINKKTTRVATTQATNMNEALAASVMTSQGDGTDSARRAEFARRLFWVMLSMR